MVQEILKSLRATEGAVVTGITTPAQADKVRTYIRLAEAKLGKPVSATWLGTLQPTKQRVRGAVQGVHGCKVLLEVVR